MSKLPKQIHYMSQTYTIRKGDVIRNEKGNKCMGNIMNKTNEIRLRHSLKGDVLRGTLLHEIIHLIFGLYSDADEHTIEHVTNGILEVLRRNKGLAEYLMEEHD